jgi:FKBP-type peptidyl-prolyl cis-trans isomerase (trigger factor)
MDRLIRNRVLEKVAKERGIQVSAKEIDDEYDKVVADSKDRKTLEEMLRALGWRESDVKEKIVRPYLLGRRLGERVGSVAEAEKIISEAIKNANTKIFVRF